MLEFNNELKMLTFCVIEYKERGLTWQIYLLHCPPRQQFVCMEQISMFHFHIYYVEKHRSKLKIINYKTQSIHPARLIALL